ncbi:MAG: phosphoribosyltransferase family protein [Chloroflexota bacterium]
MVDYLHLIDTETNGQRYDVTPLFADAGAFSALIADLALPFNDVEIDFIAGIDALGFILGGALAQHLKVGFIPIRKGGKLPVEVDAARFVDYSAQEKSLEIRFDAIPRGARLLLVDEWIETGTQIRAAIQLIEGQGGELVGIAAVNIDENDRTKDIVDKYNCHSLRIGD